MVLLIDASNIQTGGGLTHLTEVLRFARPQDVGFSKVIVCSSTKVLARLEDRSWLVKYTHPYLNQGYFRRMVWVNLIMRSLLKKENAFLFLVGSVKPLFNWPYVTICQNLLPIEWKELRRFGYSLATLRLLVLRFLHLSAYRHARGVVFLTRYCYDALPALTRKKITSMKVIPHGLNRKLFDGYKPARQEPNAVFRLLYISIINEYKHQDKVLQAVLSLYEKGIRIKLELVGPAYPRSLKRINTILKKAGNPVDVLEYREQVPYDKMPDVYHAADAFIFASTCETFGMIITEAMAMGMPIACSNKSSLPETLADAGIYFDPENVESIESAILRVYQHEELRNELAIKARQRSLQFDWELCALDTFSFLSETAAKMR
ncbi:MAG TPA: glycosyltransferase family 1 protein [Ohtaekwangia sp.]